MGRKGKTLGGRRIVAPPADLGALPREGELRNDFYVTRVYINNAPLFDKYGRLVTPAERVSHEYHGQPSHLYVRKNSQVTLGGVRDWVAGEWDDAKYNVSAMAVERDSIWRETWQQNLPLITQPMGEVEPSEIAWIVASGPSLSATAPLVPRIRNGVKIAVNWTPGWFQDEGYGTDLFDYFVCLDYKFHMMERHGPFRNTTAVLDVTVNHKVAAMEWKDRRWFLSCGGTRSEWFAQMRKAYPAMPYLDPGLSVTYAAMQFAVLALKAKTVVLVGCDCALTFGQVHPGQPAKYHYDNPGNYLVMPDVHDAPTITFDIYKFIATWTEGCGYWMKQHGIRCINATQAGIVRKHWELRNLDDTIEELNAEKG